MRETFSVAAVHSSEVLTSRFIRFLCVGFLNTLFGYSLFVIALWLGMSPIVALVSATALGILFNFQTYGRLVFGNDQPGRLPRFLTVQIAILAINALALHLLLQSSLSPWLAQGLLILPMAIVGYAAQHKLVFTNDGAALLGIGPLRVSNRLVFWAGGALFLLPNALFALQLHLLPATVLLVGVLGSGVIIATRPISGTDGLFEQSIDTRRLVICGAVALVLLLLGGESHVFFTNWDWLWRDAVLADLARSAFPPSYIVDGGTFFMRAPLGMYMLPALVAKSAGLGAGHVALLIQNAALLACVLYLLALLAGQRALLFVGIFLSFSGLDIVGEILRSVFSGTPPAVFYPPMHIENWAVFQYSSTITQLFWVPNHALPSYWIALVAIFCAIGELSLADFGLVLAMTLFWSPLAVIGGLPFAVIILLRSQFLPLNSVRFWLAVMVALCFLPVAIYLQADAAQVPHGFVHLSPLMIAAIVVFLVLKIPQVYVVLKTWNEIDLKIKATVATAIVILICLPTMRFGSGNDLVMRSSIPALMVLAFAFAQGLDAAWLNQRSIRFLAVAMVAIGLVTPAMEVSRALATRRFAVSDCNFITVWKALLPKTDVSNYLARAEAIPDWIEKRTPMTTVAQVCWPGLSPFDTLDPNAKVKAIIQKETRTGSALDSETSRASSSY